EPGRPKAGRREPGRPRPGRLEPRPTEATARPRPGRLRSGPAPAGSGHRCRAEPCPVRTGPRSRVSGRARAHGVDAHTGTPRRSVGPPTGPGTARTPARVGGRRATTRHAAPP